MQFKLITEDFCQAFVNDQDWIVIVQKVQIAQLVNIQNN